MEILIAVALAVLGPVSQPRPLSLARVTLQEFSYLLEQEIEFFSGEVTEIASDRIEVVRSALGKSDSRRFSITDETKFEGTPKKGSRVTVGYYEKSPDVASRVIVREGELSKH